MKTSNFHPTKYFNHRQLNCKHTYPSCADYIFFAGTYYKRGTTWNSLQRARIDVQRVRHNLQWPQNTYNEQRKDTERPTTSRFWDYFTIWGKGFSSLTHFPSNIWLQSIEQCFTEYHGKSRASSIYYHASGINYHVIFMGYMIYFFLSGFRVSRERGRLLF